MNNLAQRLKSLRINNNLTQKQLGKLMGVAASTISAYELSTNAPTLDNIVSYSRIFHVTTDYILGCKPETSDSFNFEGLSTKEIKAIENLIEVLKTPK